MESVDAFFLLHAVSATVVAAGVEILLNEFADLDVLHLNLVAKS